MWADGISIFHCIADFPAAIPRNKKGLLARLQPVSKVKSEGEGLCFLKSLRQAHILEPWRAFPRVLLVRYGEGSPNKQRGHGAAAQSTLA